MRKIIFASVAALSLLVAGGATANVLRDLDPWLGWLSKTGENSTPYQWKKVEIFQDRNGCQYLVATGGSTYDYGAYGISITPRINSSTKAPHCP